MGLFRRRNLVLLLSFGAFTIAKAQSDFSVTLSGGPVYYNGDLSDSRIIPPLKLFNFHYGLDATAMLTDRVELSIGFLRGKLEGDDALSNDRLKRLRNLSFSTGFTEFSLKTRLEFFKTVDFRPVNTGLILGVGFINFKPEGELNGKEVELQPLGTEGQFIDDPSYPQPYSLNSTVVMVGIGARITLSDRLALLLDLTPRITFTDYLDDVSGVYPDSAALLNTPNGSASVQLSYQGTGEFPKRGRNRGNPENNDVYIVGGISLRYYFGQTYNSGSKPGVFRRIKGSKGGWWGDRK